MDKTDLKIAFGKTPVSKIKVMREVAYSEAPVTTSGIVSTDNYRSLAGTSSFLSRTKVNGENLFEARGRDARGIRWSVNENVVDKEDLKEVFDTLLEGIELDN